MDRRVVVGLVGLMLAGRPEDCPAQVGGPGRDPSAQPSVGLVPIRSIGDSINNTSTIPANVPMAPSTVPTSPVGLGPDAAIPPAPILPTPVSIEPMEPVHHSLNRGFGSGLFSSMFRRPNLRPAATSTSGPRPRVERAPRVGPSEGPPMGLTRPSYQPSLSAASTSPDGRPAPFAGQLPELPRPQAEPVDAPGRSAPFAEERPASARPRASVDDRPREPRPRVEVEPGPPLPAPPEATPGPNEPAPSIPVELPPPPGLEAVAPAPVVDAPPPIDADPLQGFPPSPASAPIPPASAPEPTPIPEPSGSDPAVNRASRDDAAIRMKSPRPRDLPYATKSAATVGDEIITINELATAVNEKMKDVLGGQQAQMSEAERYDVTNRVAANVLNDLINQSLILQQAKSRLMKNEKARQMFQEHVDKKWKEDELPPLLRKTASANVHELKTKLAAEGKSYESMKEAFRKKVMAHEFLGMEIHNKVTADKSEMMAYYNKHLARFEQPARMTWREVEISMPRYPSPAAARQKAEETLARLLRDEDFAAVARSVSDGPTASKGGSYVDMQPGSYGIPVVNDELNRLPVGQVSRVLEAPGAFHIIRVDSRREKGPLRFDEVQARIKNQVLEENWQKAFEEYLAQLRAKTLIRTMFDQTASDPNLARRNDPAARTASGPR